MPLNATYDVTDSASFGKSLRGRMDAASQTQLRTSRLDKASSVGALMEQLNQNVLDDLQGAEITFSTA